MSKFLTIIRLSTCCIPVAKWRRSFRRYLVKQEKSIGKKIISLVPVAKYRRKWRREWMNDSQLKQRKRKPLMMFSSIHILGDITSQKTAEQIKTAFQKVGINAYFVTKEPHTNSVPLLVIDPTADFKADEGSHYIFFFTEKATAASLKNNLQLSQAHALLFSSLKDVWECLEKGEDFKDVFYLPLSQNDPDLPSQMKNHFLFSDQDWFEYFLFRFLLAQESLDFKHFYQCVSSGFTLPSDKICLTLPESRKRLISFCSGNTEGFFIFPGLRHTSGWIGCGMSYKFLMKKAKEANLPFLLVCEDDVEFLPNGKKLYQRALNYLSRIKEPWDIFSGYIADLHPQIEITTRRGSEPYEKYAHLNKMTSMVMNLYHSRFYDKLAEWDETNTDVANNTIDRYIENHTGTTIIVTYPYLVGHKRFLHSTIWSNQMNDAYDCMTEKSEDTLRKRFLIESRLQHSSPYSAAESVKVSVIIPVYNAEKYLCRCLETVLSQTLYELEVICIDDGSTDRSLEILADYADQDYRIKVIRFQKSQGTAAAKNTGRQQATGSYLGFLYPDNIVELSFFERLYEIALKSEADIVLSQLNRSYKSHEICSQDSCLQEKQETSQRHLDNSAIQNHSHLFSAYFLQNNSDIKFLVDGLFGDMFFNSEAFVQTAKIVSIHEDSPQCYDYTCEQKENADKAQIDIYKQVKLTEDTLTSADKNKLSTDQFHLLLSNLIKANNLQIAKLPFPFKNEYDDKFLSLLEKYNWDYPELQDNSLISSILEPFQPDTPLLSIIVPVYNVEKYLIPCLESINNQTFQNMEIICVEDASTDNSREVLKEYVAKNPRFKIILKEKNEGLSQARNSGISQSRAPYIAFVDSDDTIHPKMYEKMMAAMIQSNVDVVVCGVNVNYEDECLFMKPGDDRYFYLKESGLREINGTTLRDCNVVAWNKIFRKSLIDTYSLTFPVGMHFEDNAFFWKYFTHAKNVFYLKTKLYKYFRRLNSITGNIIIQNDIKHLDRIRILEDIQNHLTKYNLLQDYSSEFFSLASEHIEMSKNIAELLDERNKTLVTREMEKILMRLDPAFKK